MCPYILKKDTFTLLTYVKLWNEYLDKKLHFEFVVRHKFNNFNILSVVFDR